MPRDPAPEPSALAVSARAEVKSSLKSRALRLLAGREHSRLELERKLTAYEREPGELERVLDELQAKDFISEERVLESVLHRHAPRLGRARLEHELTNRGLSRQAIDQAMAGLQGTEVERARAVWARRFAQAATDARERARQMRFLMSRGFSAEVARKVID